ncbi:MAG: hypothetical protein NTZ05_05720 [Chloroflexi bacterium]|nr:hypothetical protein [Chloroflexota bacterium]
MAASSVTVQPNAGGAAVAYTVGADTIVRGRATELVQLKTDDPVVVVTVNSAAEARMIVSPPQARPAGGARQGGRGPQAQFFVSPDAIGAMGMSMGMAPGMGMGMGMPPTMAWMHSMADSEGDDLDALFQVAPFEDDDEVVAPPAAAPAMKVTAERDAMGGLRAMFRQGGPR